MAGLRDLHDQLLANRPPGAAHEEAACPFCLTAGTAFACQCGSTGAAAHVAVFKAENAALKTENAGLHRQLDDSVLAASRAATDLATVAEQAEFERRMSARATAAIAAGVPAGSLAEHLERWAQLTDDDFELFLEGLAAMRPAPADCKIPAYSALWAARDTVTVTASPVHDLLALRQQGKRIDVSQLR
jgi:hypothetical protein